MTKITPTRTSHAHNILCVGVGVGVGVCLCVMDGRMYTLKFMRFHG
jgi:hypothetical protein